MKKFTITNLINPHGRYKGTRLSVNSLIAVFIFIFFSTNAIGQAGDLSQIRNGSGAAILNNQKQIIGYDSCGVCWVNGNAGSSNAHYVEGMSIAYRSLLTGLEVGKCYEYEIGYDTYHGAMAIDYLTHFQRLDPHGPFGHIAEVIKPLVMVSGNNTYNMTVITNGVKTFDIPQPAASGITSGVFDKNGNSKNVSAQAQTSFNALPAAQRKMTIYNGEIEAMTYSQQQAIILGGSDAETKIKIRFRADDDSVLLAWGGHIASRLDWGYTKDSKGKLSPLSAGGISGSPYHMRQKAMNLVDCGTGANPSVLSGFGNQDRSLSAAAVIPPPECPTVPSQTVCSGSAFSAFTIASPEAGATYTWSFATNTANAAFSGGGATATGNSVTIVAGSGGFTAGGSFSFNITASLNAIEQVCTGVASGTIIKVVATASANPTTIDITTAAHSTTLTADIGAASTDANNANYDYQWSIVTAGTTGTLTNATSRVATYTAGVGDAGSSITFKVVATQKSAPSCSGEATVAVPVSVGGTCSVSAQGPVCQGATTTHNASAKVGTVTYNWVISGYMGTGTTTSTFVSNSAQTLNNGGVSVDINATQSYRITLNQDYGNNALDIACFKDVEVVPTPSVVTKYNAPGCSEDKFTVDVTNPVNGYTYRITQPGSTTPTAVLQTITPTAQSPTVHFTDLAAGKGFEVTLTTNIASCTATSSCTNPSTGSSRLATNTETTEAAKTAKDKVAETYKIVLESATKVNAVPNPFKEKIRFNLVSTISGMGSLELYNMMGQKVAVVYQGYIQAGKEVIKEHVVSNQKTSALIYVFKVGDQRVTGKLIGLK
jgi:hypothetical protein